MRSVERNPRTGKLEKTVGGSFDKEGSVIEDQSLVPTDVMTPLGTLSNLLNPAVQKSEKSKRHSPEEHQALIDANLAQLRRAVAYWTGDEAAADKIDAGMVENAMKHVHEGGRSVRFLARWMVRKSVVPPEKQERAISALTGRSDFKNILQMMPDAPQYEPREDVQSKIGERAREVVERVLTENKLIDGNAVWREETPANWEIARGVRDANAQEKGLSGVAMRVMHKAGVLHLIENGDDLGFKFPSDALTDQLRGARRFYATLRRSGLFVMDAPYKETPDARPRSLGYSVSKLLHALSSEYEEIYGEKPDLEQRIDAVRSDIAGAINNLTGRMKAPLNVEQRRTLVSILDSLKEKTVHKLYKEAQKIERDQRRGDSRKFEEALALAKAGKTPKLPSEPLPPDDFARLQGIFSNLLLTELSQGDLTIKDFITSATNGRITEFKMGAVWRDPSVSEIVTSLENETDEGRERARVEQFINNLPYLVKNAAERRSEGRETKRNIRTLGQALYELAVEIRDKRLHDARTAGEHERVSSAKETATQAKELAKTYRMFIEYGLIQPRPEPIELPDREEGQSDEHYERMVVEALRVHEKDARTEEASFRAERNAALYSHLTALLASLETDENLRGNMGARIGVIIGKKGKEFKNALRAKIAEIDARPENERYSRREKGPSWEWSEWNPYVVFDETTGKLLQPPEQMRASIDRAEKLAATARNSFKDMRQELNALILKVRLPEIAIAEIDANALDVLEHKNQDLFTLLIQTQEALKRFGTDRKSLAYRSTVATIDKLNGVVEDIRDMRANFASVRAMILRKFIEQTRRSVTQKDDTERYQPLLNQLSELELVARTGSPDEVRQAVHFFLYTE